MQVGSNLAPGSPALAVVSLSDSSHPSGHEVVFHYSFDLRVPDDSQWWASFHGLIGHLDILFGEMSFKSFAQFSIGSFAFLSLGFFVYSRYGSYSRYMICTYSQVCFFSFWVVSFEAQTFLILTKCILSFVWLLVFLMLSSMLKSDQAGNDAVGLLLGLLAFCLCRM